MKNDIAKFIGTVALMRKAQKEYFKTRNTGQLILAKGYEADVDAYLSDGLLTQPQKEEQFNQDTIGELVKKLVHINARIIEFEDKLKNMQGKESEVSVAIHDQLSDIRYDRSLVISNLIAEKKSFKLFLQKNLSRYNGDIQNPMLKPHEHDEIAHLINQTVKRIGEIDEEIKKMTHG